MKVARVLAAIVPHCFNCCRPATSHNASKSFGDPATRYACDLHRIPGQRWNDMPNAEVIRLLEQHAEDSLDFTTD